VNSVVISDLSATYSVSGNTGTNAGSYTLTCTGIGNFTGTQTKSWSIATYNLSNGSIASVSAVTYKGSAYTPTPAVTALSTTLTSGTDFTYSYANNTNAGTATVTATGKGNYTGTKSTTWTISQATIDTFTLNTTSRTYTGSSQSVSVSTCKSGSLSATYSTSGTYSATNAGSYTATVTGTGNFKGSKSVTWTMNKATITALTLNATTKNYTGSALSVSVSSCKAGSLNATYSTSGTWSATNGGTYTATVTGTGNFQGSKSATWTIQYVWNKYNVNNSYSLVNCNDALVTDYGVPYKVGIFDICWAYMNTQESAYHFDSATGVLTTHDHDDPETLISTDGWTYLGYVSGIWEVRDLALDRSDILSVYTNTTSPGTIPYSGENIPVIRISGQCKSVHKEQSKGSYTGQQVTSTSSSAYPYNGVSGDYWYTHAW